MEVVDFAFSPQVVRVAVGSEVTYRNRDAASHTVTQGRDGVAAERSAFDLALPPGAAVSVRFARAGTISVTCLLHPTMNQVVEVVP
ncbi:MAG TPA: plastocyanin/azurin family copper-binding protein [Candidatus Limnocylindrales bacterium]|nr:plastocyanin/azurin family copper-binding protein [Candidatus Limnocylindrales bacterium]